MAVSDTGSGGGTERRFRPPGTTVFTIYESVFMGILRTILIACLLTTAGACDRDRDETGAGNPPVAVWRPDSARAPSAIGDSALESTAPPVAATGEDRGEGVQVGNGAAPADAPAEPSAVPGRDGSAASQQGGAPTAPGTTAPGATEILLRAERAYDAVRTLRAEFIQDLTVPLLDSTQRSRGEVFHRKPDRFLMRFSDPAGDVVVADGNFLWLYYPSSDPGQVVRTSMGQAGRLDLQREFLSNPTERFNATLDGSEIVAGRSAKVLTLVPRTQSPYRRVRIWIDDQDSLARRFEITENNDAVRRVELRNLRVNVELPDDLFAFTPPAGAQIFDQ